MIILFILLCTVGLMIGYVTAEIVQDIATQVRHNKIRVAHDRESEKVKVRL